MADEWESHYLTDLYEIRSGLSKPRSEFGFGYGFLTFKDVMDNYFVPETLGSLVNSTEKERESCSVMRGDVFLTRTSETQEDLGMSAVALKDYEGATFNGFTKRLRPKPDTQIVPEYAAYYFRSPQFRREVTAMSSLSTRASLNNGMIERLTITLPPVGIQSTIGHTLKSLDAKIELNRRMNETLESLARALFTSWFVDFDPVRAKMDGRQPEGMDADTAALFPDSLEHVGGELIPTGWVRTTLGKEVDFQTGFAFKSKFFTEEPPGIRLARGMNVKEGEFFWSSQARYWPEVTPDIEEYSLQAGDVLIGMDGSKVGKNWVRVRAADLPCLLVQRVARLRAASSIGENFIWIVVGGSTFRYYVEAVKTGTSIPHISGGQIKSYDFIRPPRDNNEHFEHFESLVAPMTQQADNNHAESATLAALRDTLLPRLLSGELRVGVAERKAEAAMRS